MNIYKENYAEWRAEVTGVPELLSAEDKALLGI